MCASVMLREPVLVTALRTRCHSRCQSCSVNCLRWHGQSTNDAANRCVARILKRNAYQCTGKSYHASIFWEVGNDVLISPQMDSSYQNAAACASVNVGSAHTWMTSRNSRNCRVNCNWTTFDSKEWDFWRVSGMAGGDDGDAGDGATKLGALLSFRLGSTHATC